MPVASVNSRVARLLAGLTASAILLCGQANTTQKPGSVEGVTINSVTSEPIRKAAVTLSNLQGKPVYSATTDAAGKFRIENIEPGLYQPMVVRDGYQFPEQPGRHGRIRPVAVGDDQQVTGVSFQLMPLAVVGGHVLDEDGDPIANVRVMAMAFNYNPYGEKQIYPVGSAISNDLGEFEIINLQPGRYYFRAAPQRKWGNLPANTKRMTPELDYAVTYYPNAKQLGQASSTQIAPGALLTNMDFRLQEAPVFHIRGKAVSEDGKPIGRAPMFFTAAGEMSFGGPLARIQRDGSFELTGVASGTYLFFGRSAGDWGSPKI